jgi:flagellar assembly protein FliH
MAVVRKFLFDNDFGSPPETAGAGKATFPGAKHIAKPTDKAGTGKSATGKPATPPAPPAPPAPPPAPMFSEAEMQGACDIARKQGEEAGVARGKADAVSAFDKQIGTVLSGIAHQMTNIGQATALEADAAGKSTELALAIVRKLFPALAERGGIAEIEAILAQCLQSLKQEPRLVVYVNPAQLDALQARIGDLAAANGFEGRLVLIGDEKMAASDCRVEWADGGVERDSAQIQRAIDETLTNYLAVEDREAK